MLGIEAMIFDMDGVLIESQAAHRKAFEEILAPFLAPLGVSLEYQDIAGRRTDEVLRRISKANALDLSEEEIAALSDAKSARAHALIQSDPRIPEGAVSAVKSLSRSFTLALASSASRRGVDFFLEHTGLRPVFKSVLSGGDIRKAKPDPEIFLASASRTGVKPAQCLVIEDAVAGVQAGVSAGMSVWGVLGTSSAKDLLQSGAKKVFKSVAEIPKEFEREI